MQKEIPVRQINRYIADAPLALVSDMSGNLARITDDVRESSMIPGLGVIPTEFGDIYIDPDKTVLVESL